MSHVTGYPSKGKDGGAYNVDEYQCLHGDKNYVIWWSPQDTEESSEE